MTATKADQLRAQLNAKSEQARELAKTETWSEDDRALAKALTDEIGKLKTDLADLVGDSALRDALAQAGVADAKNDRPTRKGTLGTQFAMAEEIEAWLKSVAPNGQVSSQQQLRSPVVPVESRLLTGQRGRKADEIIISGTDDVGVDPFVRIDYQPDVELIGRRLLTIRDLISIRQTGSDLVHWVQQTSQLDAADFVPEARGTVQGGQGGVDVAGNKPWGYFDFEAKTADVKNIAALVAASERALEDVSQLRSLIDDELRDDLAEKMEDSIVSGNGSGESFVGIYNTPGVQAQAYDSDIFTTTRKAKTKARIIGRSRPTAWLMAPEDMETFDLAQDNEGRFYAGGPFNAGPQTLWGLPRVESEAATPGSPILADFRKAVLWDRQQATIAATNAHADFFERNLVAIRGEARGAFAITRPTAFVIVDLTP